jgi:SAM-dependent methyltransferase
MSGVKKGATKCMDESYSGDGAWMNLGYKDVNMDAKTREANLKNLFDKLIANPDDHINVLAKDEPYKQDCQRLATTMYDSTMKNKNAVGPVLDVGCGYASQSLLFHDKFPKCQYTGINIGQAQVEAGQKRVAGLPGVEIKQASATDLSDFEPNHFSNVFALECAFHFDPRTAFLEEAMKVLQPGGKLAMMDIIGYKPLWADHVNKWGYAYGTITYAATWFRLGQADNGLPKPPTEDTAPEYAAALEAAGFVNVKVEDISDKVAFWQTFESIDEPLLPFHSAEAIRIRKELPGAGNFLNWRDCHVLGSRYVHVTAEKPK